MEGGGDGGEATEGEAWGKSASDKLLYGYNLGYTQQSGLEFEFNSVDIGKENVLQANGFNWILLIVV